MRLNNWFFAEYRGSRSVQTASRAGDHCRCRHRPGGGPVAILFPKPALRLHWSEAPMPAKYQRCHFLIAADLGPLKSVVHSIQVACRQSILDGVPRCFQFQPLIDGQRRNLAGICLDTFPPGNQLLVRFAEIMIDAQNVGRGTRKKWSRHRLTIFINNNSFYYFLIRSLS